MKSKIATIPTFHAMLKEIFETGDLSEKHQRFVQLHLESIGQSNLDELERQFLDLAKRTKPTNP